MTYFFLLFLIFVGILVFDIAKYKKNRETYFYFIFVLLSFVSGLSYRLGTDVVSYMSEYNEYSSLFNISSFEYFFSFSDRMPLWVFVNTFFRTFGFSFFVFHLFQVLVINLSICSVLKKYANCSFISILLYTITIFPLFNYEIMRESFAVSVFLSSVHFFMRAQYFRYYICVIIALGFHLSALALFVCPLIKLFPLNKWGIVSMLLITLCVFFFSEFFTSKLLLLINIDFLSDKALGYFSDERYAVSKLSFSYVFNVLFYVILPYVLSLHYLKNIDVKKLEIFYFVAVYAIVYCFTIVVPIFYRINNYFIIFFLCYISNIPSIRISSRIPMKITCFAGYIVLVLFVLLKLNVYLSSIEGTSYPSYRRYFPYSSIFLKELDKERERIL